MTKPKFIQILFLTLSLASCCNQENLPSNIEGLYSSEAKIRNESALALARCGSDAEEAVNRLAQLLYDENVGVQSSAAYALRKIGTPTAQEELNRAIERREKQKRSSD